MDPVISKHSRLKNLLVRFARISSGQKRPFANTSQCFPCFGGTLRELSCKKDRSWQADLLSLSNRNARYITVQHLIFSGYSKLQKQSTKKKKKSFMSSFLQRRI